MALKRRMGPENSAARFALMDAVEAVMREQGYAALSARSVAARASLKYQLVFYYFETMDDLLLAAYRRRTETVLTRLEQALDSPRPLHAFWQASSDPVDAALSLEYMAMSNHNQVIRAETIAFGERFRRIVAEKLTTRLRMTNPNPKVFTPFGVTVAINLMGSILGFDSALGISGGHLEVETIVAWCLRQLEPDAANPI
ncbi:MAG: TetR/AcrR family transcriptional regulator [Rhizomicrobium sp.]